MNNVRKTSLDAALEKFANPANSMDVLRVVHAVLTTAMVNSALEKSKSSVTKAAKAECYAEAIELIELRLEGPGTPYTPAKKTVLTTPGGMPVIPKT